MSLGLPRRFKSPPLAVQIFGMLLTAVLVAQGLILAIVMLVPPPPPDVYTLEEVAAAIRGESVQPARGRTLVRSRTDAKPEGGAPPSERRLTALAEILGASPADLHLSEAYRERWRRRPSPQPLATLAAPGLPGPPPFGGRDRLMVIRRPGMGPPIVGPFVVALKEGDGWTVVKPRPEPFPDAWQRRLLLWMVLSAAALALVSWVFARRFAAPVRAFAGAADRLGRDLDSPPVAPGGAAEFGLMADAFNTMQDRLKRYLDDRTAMIAAIAHDLRTPLTRLRFRLEAAPPEVRRAAVADIDEMQAMISAVLQFVRDAGRRGERTLLDLTSLLESVVDDAAVGGAAVRFEPTETHVVEADGAALRRLFANLIENALAYGETAAVSLRREGETIVAEVEDNGPGLPEAELERVFEPFHRGEPSRNRETGGIGLGLAIVRSIARGHGGDVTLANTGTGLRATVRLPAARM